MKEHFSRWVIAILAIAIGFRVALFLFALWHVPPSTDEAWPALMGLHVLKGEFPVFYWGQAYMGAQQAYFDAALYPWLGCQVATTRLYPLLFSILFLLATYGLARTVYDRTTARIALALLAVPVPYLAMCGAISVPPEYLVVATLGSLALILLTRIVFRDPGRPSAKHTTLLGFILGFTFWLHLMALSYIGVALLFLFLKDKWIFFRRAFWGGALGFIVGSLPFWGYNLAHGFETFRDVGQTVEWTRSLALLQAAFGITLHFLIGLKVMLYGDSRYFLGLPTVLQIILGILWVSLLGLAIGSRYKALARLGLLSVKGPGASDGTGILLALFAATLFLFCRSARAGWADPRFLFPVLSVLPVLMAFGLSRLRAWSSPAFAALLAFIIGCQLWGNLLLAQAWSDPRVMAEELDLPETEALHRFLKEQGLRHAYAHYWLSYRLTFESKEELICSEPYNERFPGRTDVKFIDEVRAAPRVAYIVHPNLRFTEENFETLLQRIGGAYRKQSIGCFTVFYDFTPPYGKLGLKEISRDGWRITADRNPADISNVMDGDPATVWESQCPQTAGMQLTVDLGQKTEVCLVRFDLGRNVTDYPRGYQLETSLEGTHWRYIGNIGDVGIHLFWEGNQPWFLVAGDHFNAAFPTVDARFVKITLTADDPEKRWWWALAELRMFGPDR